MEAKLQKSILEEEERQTKADKTLKMRELELKQREISLNTREVSILLQKVKYMITY